MSGARLDIRVNGEERTIDTGATVADLLTAIRAEQRGIAVARNEEVVPRSAWPRTVLQTGDRIEILDAAQGG